MERLFYEITRRGRSQGDGRRWDRSCEEGELSREEIKEAVRSLKDGKAARSDGILREVWKYGGKNVIEWGWQFCNRVWKEERWPVRWKEGMIIPIIKKGERKVVEEYKGVTLMAVL